MPIDFEVGGVYLPPIAQALIAALPLFLAFDWLLRRLGLMRLVWHEALFEGALYAFLCAAVVLLMGGLN